MKTSHQARITSKRGRKGACSYRHLLVCNGVNSFWISSVFIVKYKLQKSLPTLVEYLWRLDRMIIPNILYSHKLRTQQFSPERKKRGHMKYSSWHLSFTLNMTSSLNQIPVGSVLRVNNPEALLDFNFYWCLWPVAFTIIKVRGVASTIVLFASHRKCLERDRISPHATVSFAYTTSSVQQWKL